MLTDDVADVALGLILMTGRGFVRLSRFVHAGEWEKRAAELTTKLSGRKVGILGLGRIGKAHRGAGNGDGHEGCLYRAQAAGLPYEYVPDLKSLAAAVDFLVVACPGGEATRNIVNAEVLAALGKKGTLINIARGSIVDEPALVAALKAGVIKAAGLDVFANEPHIPPEADAWITSCYCRMWAARPARRGGNGRPVQGQPRRVFSGKGVLTLIPGARVG